MRIALGSWWRPRWELLLVAAVAIVALAMRTSPPRPAPAPSVGFRLSGTVHAATDVLPAWVIVWNSQRRLIAEADADGRWSMTLPPGEYRIGASRLPEVPARDLVVDIAIDADLDGIALLLDRDGLPGAPDVRLWARGKVTWIEGVAPGIVDGAITVEVTSATGVALARRIVRVQNGAYRLVVTGEPRSLLAHRWPMRDQRELESAGAGPVRVDLDLVERPVGTAFGRVIDRDGRPLARVTVEAPAWAHFADRRAVAVTDDDGYYAIPVRAGGSIMAYHEGQNWFAMKAAGPGPWPMDLDLARAGYDTGCDHRFGPVQHVPPTRDERARLRALAASRAGASILSALAPAAGFRIAGTVHADADVAASWVIASNAEQRAVARVGDDGRWSMTLPAGDYRIGASRLLADPADDVSAELTVDGDVDDLRLILDRGPMWSRSYAHAASHGGEEVWIEGAAAGVRDGVITVEVGTNASILLARRIVRVRDGRYRLRVAGKPWEISAHRWPMYEHRIDDEIPAPRAGTVRLDLDLTDAPVVTVFGRVMDVAGLPAANVEVEAYHPGDLTGRRGTTWTDGEGRYALPVRAGGRIVVHHVDRFEFTARGIGPGPWPMPLDLARAERVATDCFHEPSGDRYYVPWDEEWEQLQALAVGRGRTAGP
jgi:hypothetical protein